MEKQAGACDLRSRGDRNGMLLAGVERPRQATAAATGLSVGAPLLRTSVRPLVYVVKVSLDGGGSPAKTRTSRWKALVVHGTAAADMTTRFVDEVQVLVPPEWPARVCLSSRPSPKQRLNRSQRLRSQTNFRGCNPPTGSPVQPLWWRLGHSSS